MHQKPEPPEPGASETAIGLLGLGKTPVETEPPYRGKHIHTYLPTYIHTYRKYSYIPKKINMASLETKGKVLVLGRALIKGATLHKLCHTSIFGCKPAL